MPSNLSFSKHSDTGSFYTEIHKQVRKAANFSGKPPTVEEFRHWLESTIEGPAKLSFLDAGCGVHGLNARECIAAGFASGAAIDINPDAISLNQDIGAEFGSVLDIPFKDSSFDFVICSGVVHHTPDPEKAINEIYRVLKPGGFAYISIYAFRHSLFHFIVLALRAFATVIPFSIAHRLLRSIPAGNNFFMDHAYVPILWLYRDKEMRNLLSRVGFSLKEDFPTSFDIFSRWPLGFLLSGGGLMRVYILQKENTANDGVKETPL